MKPTQTDWDSYYSQPYKTAAFTRQFTRNALVGLMKKFRPNQEALAIAEWGGGNSAFFEDIYSALQPAQYHLLDNNQMGLDKFSQRVGQRQGVALHQADVLNPPETLQADIVYSVGLIEHFDPVRTAQAIKSHFKTVKPGGLVIITFPTPTFLYRATRSIAEGLGQWIFHDERPLQFEEVLKSVKPYGTVVHQQILWPLFLTQGVLAIQT